MKRLSIQLRVTLWFTLLMVLLLRCRRPGFCSTWAGSPALAATQGAA